MHILQSKTTKLNAKDAEQLLAELNVSKAQMPKILVNDPGLPDGCLIGDIVKIERKEGDKINIYYRVVV
ncbi:MAG: DNA-directed RNA polymerase subunit RpoH/Rpb5 C-terminal domain-containing protein [archaeon]